MGKLLQGIRNAVTGLDEPPAWPAQAQVSSLPLIDLRTGEQHWASDVLEAYYSNAFRACLLAKARPVSALPVDVYVRLEGLRNKADSEAARSLSNLLRHRWNPQLTASEGISWALMTKDTLGNAFVRVQWANGSPVALWPMRSAPKVTLTGDGAVYDYPGDKTTPPGRYLQWEVLWIKSPVLDKDGVWGVSLAELAARELGLSISLETFYEKLISNGNHFPQWLETDQKLDARTLEQLKQTLADHKGLTSAGETRIFDSGLSVKQPSMTIADMSLVEQETWILQQTCRTLSVPPQQVYDLSRSTYSNSEQGALDFAKNTLVYECNVLEQAFSDILWAAGSPESYVQFDLNGLLRGDYKSRMDGYRTGILSGFFTPNQVCAWEDLPPYDGGNLHLIPSSYSAIDPVTGTIIPGTSEGADVGGAGEGVAQTTGNPNGRPVDALAPVHADMERRARERFRDKGDTPAARDFARRVLAPYAEAALAAGIAYDIETDIERMARDARH